MSELFSCSWSSTWCSSNATEATYAVYASNLRSHMRAHRVSDATTHRRDSRLSLRGGPAADFLPDVAPSRWQTRGDEEDPDDADAKHAEEQAE